MHDAKLLATAIQAGYAIREEVLDGAGGGHCLIHGKKCLLLDITQSYREQLSDVLDALRAEPELDLHSLPKELAGYLEKELERAA